MRMRIHWSLLLGLSLIVNLGCGWFGGSAPSGGVAVVDLDEIARQVGADDEIAQGLKAREAALNSELQTIKVGYVQQLKERKSLYGETPTEEQSEQLVSISRQINLNLVTAQQKAASALSSHRSQLIMKFREQVGPVAEQIAKQRGLSIVVPKNEGWLLAVDENVNITDEVAQSLKLQWKPIVSNVGIAPPQPPMVATPAAPTHDPHSQGVQPASHLEHSSEIPAESPAFDSPGR